MIVFLSFIRGYMEKIITISEYIKMLQDIQKEHGDLVVVEHYFDGEYNCTYNWGVKKPVVLKNEILNDDGTTQDVVAVYEGV